MAGEQPGVGEINQERRHTVGRIPDEDIQRVRDATDVVQLISESVVLKKKGRLFWGLCPFHGEKTPSFKVDPGTQLWHCFGCGEGGDVFGFLMRTDHVEFPDAVRQLADRNNIEIHEQGESIPRSHKERLSAVCEASAAFYHKMLVSSPDEGPARARDYLKGRGFGIDVAKRFELGYSPGRGSLVAHLTREGFTPDELIGANVAIRSDGGSLRDRFYERVMFPIRDITGKAVGFGGRVLGDGEPKYLNTGETPVFHKGRNLYAIDRAKNPIVAARQAVVVEGYTDVIALHEAGLANTVATLGTALTRDHVKLLGRFASTIVYLFDADEAGLRAAERAAEFIDVSVASPGSSAIELKVAVVPAGKDPADYAATHGGDALREITAAAQPLLEFVLQRRLEAHDTDTPEGRSRALGDAASVLASVKGTLLAQDYANYVADRLLIDYSTVMAEVERARPAFAAPPASTATPSESQGTEPQQAATTALLGPAEKAQRTLVGMIAADPRLRTKARSLLASDLLAEDMSHRLLETILEAGTRPADEIVTGLQASDPQMATVLSGLLVDTDGNEDGELFARALVRKLKEFALERQIRQKKALMNTLDPVKESDRYDELYREIAALQVRVSELRQEADGSDDDMEEWG